NLFIALSFTGALLATYSFYQAAKKDADRGWQSLGKVAFQVHSVAIVGIIFTLFVLLVNHYFEYNYAWQHSSTVMPMRYILACFWEGQEGSFLLWTFWNMVLAQIFMLGAKTWLNANMTIISSVQVFLASMLLGVYILDFKIGSNPFILLREHPDMMNLPFTKVADYASKIDGKGLNPLLQNYWMIIHPPTLFLGFASTLIPFSYAIAGFWKGRFNEWQKPALPWAYFGVMILGTGILMGGIWAYEALSFGGFWAWDPVENASLVPWITLVGAAHVMLLTKVKVPPIKLSFLLVTITFIYVLYSTYLTRSGVLGDTSVHAFTSLGISLQLQIFLFFFILLSILAIVLNWKKLPRQDDEERLSSREFWMLIGSLVLFISAFQIIFTTSIPVINYIFGTDKAPPNDPIQHYNSWQIPLSAIIATLMAIGQFLKYKSTKPKDFLSKISPPLLVGTVLTGIIIWGMEMYNYFHWLLLFASVFAIIANLDYFIRVMKGKVLKAGASISHVGIGMILLGALISTSNSEVISENSSGLDISALGPDFSNKENIMLGLNDTLRMGEYMVSYRGAEKIGVNIYFNIDYYQLTEKGDGLEHVFTLKPIVQMNATMGNVAEPDTRHFLRKDIYTHVTYADLERAQGLKPENRVVETSDHLIKVGDTIFSSNAIITLEKLDTKIDVSGYALEEGDLAVGAHLTAINMQGETRTAKPIYIIKGREVYTVPDTLDGGDIVFYFDHVDPIKGEVNIRMTEMAPEKKDFIILKAIVFPYINVLWSGIVIMFLGTAIAIRNRVRVNRASSRDI
ncbi:MAG: cytochrome c biogenesis protein CcsA, partial [Flavobacteriales bacterium]|nr:cytochrome c biogenesis protein CcsA [Flavobacteriales bacterium]